MTNDESWYSNFEALKAHVAETGHFPSKHTKLNNLCCYQRKRIKLGNMPKEQQILFEKLAASRRGGHTGMTKERYLRCEREYFKCGGEM